MTDDLSIAFIGAGNMAGALIRGLIGTATVSPGNIVAADPDQARLDSLESDLAIQVTPSNGVAVQDANVVLLATKPQVFDQVLPDLAPSVRPGTLVISIAAGVSTQTIEGMLPDGTHVVRSMPNTPALVGAGATAVAGGVHATAEDMALAQRIFESVGIVVQVPESQIDAVTGVSGSGPAYVFAMIEAMRDGGTREGLPGATALQLAAQTVLGAARLLVERGEAPESLRQKVTSPGGTTLAGLQALDANGFREAILGAVRAATHRSTELGSR